MAYSPLGARVVVKVVPTVEKTKGGILMPGVVQESLHVGPVWATVTAVGPDVQELSVGDRALMPKGGGTEVSDEDGTKYVVILEADIFGVLED